MTGRGGSSTDWDVLSPGYVGKLRARDPHDLLSTHRGLCGACAVGGVGFVTLVSLSKDVPLRQHLGAYAVLATLGIIAITAHVALQPGARLRPIAALRCHALALFGVGAALVGDLTDVALLAPKPPPSYHWVPFVSALVFTYSVGLIAATWLTTPGRYLTTVLGSLAVAWEGYLALRLFVLPFVSPV